MDQVELATAVSLTGADGWLNPAAVGWARRPILDTSGIVKGPHRTWGRTKRWEYWNVISPTHILSLTVSSIDYAAVHECGSSTGPAARRGPARSRCCQHATWTCQPT